MTLDDFPMTDPNLQIVRDYITAELALRNETWADVVATTLTEAQLNGTRGDLPADLQSQGSKFAVWTSRFVYVPLCDGSVEWLISVPRNPPAA